jgi:hypothetical protein
MEQAPAKAEALTPMAWLFDPAGRDAAQAALGRAQSVTKDMLSWSQEIVDFAQHRLARNGQTLRTMADCNGWPEVMDIEAQWVRSTLDDYMQETSRLMEATSRIAQDMFGSAEATEPQQTADDKA